MIDDDFSADALSDVQALIASGRNGGTGGDWSGTGIVTSAASANLTTLGVARASDVLGISDYQTTVFAGQTVDGAAVLIKFTYAGDANLDGKINVDDYGKIDFAVPIGVAGWSNGDFNYDGKVNVDDYGIIDFNVAIQGNPL